MAWRTLGVALLLPIATAQAAPYLVEFTGQVTSITDDAPGAFWIGERVAGRFVYDPDERAELSVTQEFNTVDTPPPSASGWPSSYTGFPQERQFYLSEIFAGGPIVIVTEGGFAVRDHATDHLWFGNESHSGVTFGSSGGQVHFFGNRGRFLNLYSDWWPDLDHVALTIETIGGPAASGLQIDFAPVEHEIVWNDDTPSVSRRSIADPDDLRIIGGGFLFGGNEPLFESASVDVGFEIDTVRVIAVPEPAGCCLLIVTLQGLVGLQRRPRECETVGRYQRSAGPAGRQERHLLPLLRHA